LTCTCPICKKTKEDEIEKARKLIEGAMNSFKLNAPDKAMWKLVDAAGILSKVFPGQIGDVTPTGMGFQIKDTHNGERNIRY
jgi:hypothetical protein